MRRTLPTLLLAATTIAVATAAGLAKPAAAQSLTAATSVAARTSGPFIGDADGGGTSRGDLARDGWYSDEPGLNPATVESPAFRQLFSTSVSGQVYAQPILDDGVVLVGTEEDWIYGLNPVTGEIEWKRQVGNYFPDASLGCGDLTPNLGITSTPTVDPATGIAYFVDQQYLGSGTSGPTAFFMHAINPANGTEEPHFPVEIQGSASNDPSEPFVTDMQNQRAGLLLLGGVLYAAFSSHCDIGPYWGFVVGVSTAGRQTTMWSDAADTSLPADSNSGGGIWQAGTGLVSDGPNQILLTIGNGSNSPSGTIPGSSPPADLGESTVRLVVQPNGSLKATDFFTPTDAAYLDSNDLDFGTGGPILLPPQFGTPKYPNLLVAGGKEGYLYLLNRDNLGGVGNGPGGTDGTLDKVATAAGAAPYPMLFGSAGVWPGNGGYIYVPTSNSYGSGPLEAFSFGATGARVPTLTLATPATSAPTIGYASASPIVTSAGTTPGSAVVWVVSTGSGPGNPDGELEAFAALPAHGTLQLLRSWPIGTANKFNGPGVGGDRLYVATQVGGQDGRVLGFGEAVSTTALSGATVTFPATRTGSTATATLVVTARQPTVTVTALSSGSVQFAATTTPSLPVTLNQGGQFKLTVTFTPAAGGEQRSGLTLYTSAGQVTFPASGSGLTIQQFDVGGYRLATSSGGVYSFGDTLPSWCPGRSAVPTDPVINAAATPDGAGCWLTTQHGAVIAAGDAHLFGSEAGKPLKSPIVGFAATADGLGYWLVAADGGIFGFGDARFYGSTGGIHLKKPIVGMSATPTGHGYWLVASDGGIFAFGDARFYGSAGGIHLKSPIVGMAATPTGHGYWFVAADGGIFAFGDARFLGSEGSDHLTSPVIGMASTDAGEGYWLAQANGSVKAFGDALYEGSAVVPAPESVVAVIRP